MKSNQLIAEFITYLKSKRKSNSTLIAYQKDLAQLAESTTKKLDELTANDVRQFIDSLKKFTPKTVSRKLNSYRTFYKYLKESNKISSNPAVEVPHPRLKTSKPRFLNSVEYLALRQVTQDNLRLSTMIELLLQTGIRIGELARLVVGDVDFSKSKGTLHVSANSTTPARDIELNSAAIKALKRYLKSSIISTKNQNAPLFTTRDAKPIIIRNIRSSIDRGIDKAGIKNACVNDLRNTFIVQQLTKGVPLELITDYVGHRSKSTTQRYVSLVQGKYAPKASSHIADL